MKKQTLTEWQPYDRLLLVSTEESGFNLKPTPVIFVATTYPEPTQFVYYSLEQRIRVVLPNLHTLIPNQDPLVELGDKERLLIDNFRKNLGNSLIDNRSQNSTDNLFFFNDLVEYKGANYHYLKHWLGDDYLIAETREIIIIPPVFQDLISKV